jgi:NADH-quinone oxidoreductase subunit A
MNPYGAFFVYLLAILGFVALTLWLNKVVGPKPAPTAMKLEPFECGATAIEQVNVKAIPVKYYAIAIVFILFDLETVFLFLWALGAQPLTGALLAALGVFLVLLVVIMLYVWRTGLLEEVTQ